jgi:uncharacterized protein YggE
MIARKKGGAPMFSKFVLIAIMVAPFSLLSQDAATRQTLVRVTGEAAVETPPDLAVVDIAVTTEGSRAIVLASKNADKVNAVLKAVKSVVGANGEVETLRFSADPSYRWYPYKADQTLVTNTIRVKVHDPDLVSQVIDQALAAGATQIRDVKFDFQNRNVMKRKAVESATKEALAYGEAIVQSLGLHVSSIVDIQTLEAAETFPLARDVSESRQLSAKFRATPTPIETSTISLKTTVVMTLAAEK